jgi:hypothetical protein
MKPIFRYWLAQLLRGARKQPPRFKGIRVEFAPQRPESNTVYVIGDDEGEWAVVFVCPCGCGQQIHLSLATDARPSWRVRQHARGRVTLVPSVWRTVGCKSHFIIYRGHVFWCADGADEWGATDSERHPGA